VTALRQSRLSFIASTTTQWDGQLNAQGFILNLNNVEQWKPFTKYTKGEIVLYKKKVENYWGLDQVYFIILYSKYYLLLYLTNFICSGIHYILINTLPFLNILISM
jgi:hypothetical protein